MRRFLRLVSDEFAGRGKVLKICHGAEIGVFCCMAYAAMIIGLFPEQATSASVALRHLQEYEDYVFVPFALSSVLLGPGLALYIGRVYEFLPPTRWAEKLLRWSGLLIAFIVNFWLTFVYLEVKGVYIWWAPWYLTQCAACIRAMGFAYNRL